MYTLFRVYSTWLYKYINFIIIKKNIATNKSNNLILKLGKHVYYYHFFKLPIYNLK